MDALEKMLAISSSTVLGERFFFFVCCVAPHGTLLISSLEFGWLTWSLTIFTQAVRVHENSNHQTNYNLVKKKKSSPKYDPTRKSQTVENLRILREPGCLRCRDNWHIDPGRFVGSWAPRKILVVCYPSCSSCWLAIRWIRTFVPLQIPSFVATCCWFVTPLDDHFYSWSLITNERLNARDDHHRVWTPQMTWISGLSGAQTFTFEGWDDPRTFRHRPLTPWDAERREVNTKYDSGTLCCDVDVFNPAPRWRIMVRLLLGRPGARGNHPFKGGATKW